MIISIDTEKNIWQSATSIHDENPQQSGLKGNMLNIIKAMYEKPKANIILNWKNWELFP